MLLVRIAGLLAALAVGLCTLLWLLTGERKWLRYAWTLFSVTLAVLAVFLALLFAERLLDL